ncbi:MAG: DUF1801 domain-containing protein [Chloroflexi bacterium]|nr:MAG: DUF1801 domain-containing protein [Chloroflexota bacterium]
MATAAITVADHLKKIPPAVRPTVQAARRVVKGVAPKAEELAYQSSPPRSRQAMYKIIRYTVEGEAVVAIGTFPTYATLFFRHGRELDDGSGLLQGGGKEFRFIRLASPADAERPAVKRIVRKAFALAR